jgi:hypothetical protein
LIAACNEVLGQSAASKMKGVPLSKDTVERRISDMAEDTERQIAEKKIETVCITTGRNYRYSDHFTYVCINNIYISRRTQQVILKFTHLSVTSYKSHNGMASIKFIASQALTIFQYKTTRIKVLKCCANIYFNKQCLSKKIVPSYAKIKLPNTSTAARNTQRKIHSMRIRDEIKFLYKKKQQLNNILYKIHLEAA